MKNIFFLIATFLVAFQISSAQSCEQIDYSGFSHQFQCGTAADGNCYPCMPATYSLLCEDEGIYYVFIALSNNLYTAEDEDNGVYVEFQGDVEFTIDETGLIVNFVKAEGEPLLVRMTKYDASGNIIAFGEINELSPPCSKGSDAEDCPEEGLIVVANQNVYFDDTYAAKLSISGGVPPYQIYDNQAEQFFQANVEEGIYYLGNFPYNTLLDFTIVDDLGCVFDIQTNALVPVEVTDETAIDFGTEAGTDDPTDDPTETGTEAGTDTPTDDLVEVGTEAGTDDPTETGTEAGTDISTDDPTEAGTEAGTDNVAVEEIETVETTLQIAPNPLQKGDVLRLSWMATQHATVSLVVFDIQGRQIAALQASQKVGQNEIELFSQNFKTGLYFMGIQSATEMSGLQKVLIFE